MMNICFFDSNPNENSGSYRIWVKDLCKTFQDIGIKSRICNNFDELQRAEEDIIIFSKSSYSEIANFKNKDSKIIGAINIPCDSKIKSLDFVIVGSHEERISLSFYNNVFLYPLIERKFMNLPKRVHQNSETFKICYHGNYPHLFKFTPHLRDAIEEINKSQKTELHIVTGAGDLTNWWSRDIGKPNISVHYHHYDKIAEVINYCDVGVVPNVVDMSYINPDIKSIKSTEMGLYDTDYFLRMKNKTNPGRAYVFYQFGLPVIHDISPSSFEMMSFTGIYDLAHNKQSWIKCLNKYNNVSYRQEISERFRTKFEKKYNPEIWAKKIYKEISEIKND